MSIMSSFKMLCDAREKGYAIGAFNVENMEMVQAVIDACVEEHSPVIVQTSVNTLKYASPAMFYKMVEAKAEEVDIPVCIHLDHGGSLYDIVSCVKVGYKSVMYDGSLLSYSENVENTKAIVDLCELMDVTVEGELGAISGKKGAPEDSSLLYTNVETAVDFVERTKVNSLAVAIGTVHGKYKKEPRLDYQRLSEIHHAIDIPLVLHGASGLADEQIKKCIKNGICKINFATDLRQAWTKTYRVESMKDFDICDPKVASKVAREAVKNVVLRKLTILGSRGKAWA